MGVGLILIATGRYSTFVPAVVASAAQHIQHLDAVFVCGEPSRRSSFAIDVEFLPWAHTPWPMPTLLRYRAISSHRAALERCDTLLYVDVDMRFERSFEVPEAAGLFAVRHPFYEGVPPDELPYERVEQSRAFVPWGGGGTYYAGGVQGGTSVAYLDACAEMAQWIDEELEDGRVPVWHDESIWNRWLIEHPPATVLGVEYCWPERREGGAPVIVALQKDHVRLRARSLPELIVIMARRALRSLLRGVRRVARR